MTREAFLERVRNALASSTPRDDARRPDGAAAVLSAPPDPPPLPDPVRRGDPLATFIQRGRQVGMRVEDVASRAAVAEFLAALCVERRVGVAAVWNDVDLEPAADRLRRGGVTVLVPGASVQDAAHAGLGVTGAEWGIAESATVVLPSGPDQPRLTSLLPPLHVAVLRVDRILPDLPALFARTTALPSALTFVTGPSRSADIGFTPVLGAHGPTEVIVLLLQ